MVCLGRFEAQCPGRVGGAGQVCNRLRQLQPAQRQLPQEALGVRQRPSVAQRLEDCQRSPACVLTCGEVTFRDVCPGGEQPAGSFLPRQAVTGQLWTAVVEHGERVEGPPALGVDEGEVEASGGGACLGAQGDRLLRSARACSRLPPEASNQPQRISALHRS